MGTSDYSFPSTSFLLPYGTCLPPTDVTAAIVDYSGPVTVVINWNAPTNTKGTIILHYLIQTVTSTSVTYENATPTNETTITFTNLSADEYYTFYVAAVTDKGNSAFSKASNTVFQLPQYVKKKRYDTYSNTSTAIVYRNYIKANLNAQTISTKMDYQM